MPAQTADVLVIGAGMAGASAAAHVAASFRVILIEREAAQAVERAIAEGGTRIPPPPRQCQHHGSRRGRYRRDPL